MTHGKSETGPADLSCRLADMLPSQTAPAQYKDCFTQQFGSSRLYIESPEYIGFDMQSSEPPQQLVNIEGYLALRYVGVKVGRATPIQVSSTRTLSLVEDFESDLVLFRHEQRRRMQPTVAGLFPLLGIDLYAPIKLRSTRATLPVSVPEPTRPVLRIVR